MNRNLLETIPNRFDDAVYAALGEETIVGKRYVFRCNDPRFGDYQFNGSLALAKVRKQKPRDVATAIVEHLKIDDLCEQPDIAGPGFINVRLKPSFLGESLGSIPSADPHEPDRMGLARTDSPDTVVVDLSSPNIAKEMHVGHLRSTIIGDAIARILEFEGHVVHRLNHIGDWGTQFGMLIAHLRHVRPEAISDPSALAIADMEKFYVEAKKHCDTDPTFQEEARRTVVALQAGDPQTRKIWKAFCDESLRHCHRIYERLNVRLEDRGESFYNELMVVLIDRLLAGSGPDGEPLVVESQGALCDFSHGKKTKNGDPYPEIVRKSDGGFNYNTSDLAALLHRVEQMHATRLIYVVGLGAGTKEHFDWLFPYAKKTGWIGDDIELRLCGFGNILGSDNRPLKTRDGGTYKLKDLLDEAVARARGVITDESRSNAERASLSEQQIDQIAETVGIAAVKYVDLAHSLTTDYKFDLKTMCSLEGNTAPYLLYAYARIRSIGRKAGVNFADLPTGDPLLIDHATEVTLATKLVQFPETLERLGRELEPNVLTIYLYDLARAFSRFYDRKFGVRVVDASPDTVRTSRLRLCDLTARTLKLGLDLLGIGTVEQM